MAFNRPTLQQIIERVEGDIKGALSIVIILRRSFLAAISRAIAGVGHVLHGHLVFISKQIFPDQAEEEFLDRWGSIYSLERNPAIFAQLNVEFVFTAAGSVPLGTVIQRSDGVEYTVDAEVLAGAGGTFAGVVTASIAGSEGNVSDGSILALQSPIANVAGDVEVTSTAIEGENQETDPAFRQRIVNRIQEPPSGGTTADYERWALEVTGVTRAWVFPAGMGPGTVSVTFVQDDDTPSIIPDAAELAAVLLNITIQKPVTAEIFVFPPIENTVDLDIAIKPNTTAVQASVTTELQDLFRRETEVKGAVDGVVDTFDGVLPISRIDEAISIAAGEEDHNILNITENPEPLTIGGLLILGTITFSTLV